MSEPMQNFETAKQRLDEIVDAVNTEDISLDAALDLYEEAVKIGMQVSTMIEEDIGETEVEEGLRRLDEDSSESGAQPSESGAQPSETEAQLSSHGEANG